MTNIQKFRTDIQKLIKHYRAEHSKYNIEEVSNQIISFFEKESTCPRTLSGAVAQYWKEEFIDTSADPENEPSMDNINILGALLSFLEATDEDEDLLSDKNWKDIAELVTYEAEDLPIDILQALMSTLVRKSAI